MPFLPPNQQRQSTEGTHLLLTYLLMGMMLSGVCKQTETSSCSGDYGRSYVYRVDRVGLCDYMINFIHRLRSLPETYMMNSVLENFTVLQVILSRRSTDNNNSNNCEGGGGGVRFVPA